MRPRALYALIVVGVAAVSHVAAIWAVPRVVMRMAFRAGEKRTGGDNRAYHFKLPAADSRDVVLPSPDILYAGCIYDVSKGPVSITAEVPESYWSVALYADNTDNFFVLDDRQVAASHAEVILVAAGTTPPPGRVVVTAPTTRGLVLFRTLVLDHAKLDALQRLQRTEECAPLR